MDEKIIVISILHPFNLPLKFLKQNSKSGLPKIEVPSTFPKKKCLSTFPKKEDSKGCRMDMTMIFSSSKRWTSIFFIFHITEPPTEPLHFRFLLYAASHEIFYRDFWGFLCAQESRGSVRGSVQLSQKLNIVKIYHSQWKYTYNFTKYLIYLRFVWNFAFFGQIPREYAPLGAP